MLRGTLIFDSGNDTHLIITADFNQKFEGLNSDIRFTGNEYLNADHKIGSGLHTFTCKDPSRFEDNKVFITNKTATTIQIHGPFKEITLEEGSLELTNTSDQPLECTLVYGRGSNFTLKSNAGFNLTFKTTFSDEEYKFESDAAEFRLEHADEIIELSKETDNEYNFLEYYDIISDNQEDEVMPVNGQDIIETDDF